MPYDGLSTYAVAAELSRKLIGTKIHKIYQPVKDEIVLSFSDKEKSTLLISANASFPRVHLINEKYDNPDHPPAFCMLMRKYLIGGIVKDVVQVDFDRIVTLKIETLDEAGCLLNLLLTAEIMGKHSNLFLINESSGKILDAIKHVTKLKTSIREVMPGKPYLPPHNGRLNPMDFEVFHAAERMLFFAEKTPANAMLNVFSGISPQLAASLVNDSNIPNDKPTAALSHDQLIGLCAVIRVFFNEVRTAESYLYSDTEGNIKDFSYSKYSAFDEYTVIRTESISQACELYYKRKRVVGHISEKYESTIKLLSSLISKEEHKLKLRKEELEHALDSEPLYRYGNLLLSNLHLIQKGMSSIAVSDYFSEQQDEIIIPLRADFTPSQNAQMYFKKYAKAKSAVDHLTRLIDESSDLIYYLTSQHYYLTNAQTAADAEEVLEELTKRGILKKKKSYPKQQKSVPYHYMTNDGFDVYVGKNDKQNDQLTLKSASKNDLWLHTKDIPGSHVILKTNHGTFSDESLKEAAEIAAHHSKASDSENVPVDYTFIKYVKKPSGSPLGKVIFTNNKTLFVTPRIPSEQLAMQSEKPNKE